MRSQLQSDLADYSTPCSHILISLLSNRSLNTFLTHTHTCVSTHLFFLTHTDSGDADSHDLPTYLAERCRISVRDLLVLPAILISSFSSESAYWASWSRLWAQSARLASSWVWAAVCLENKGQGLGGGGSVSSSTR